MTITAPDGTQWTKKVEVRTFFGKFLNQMGSCKRWVLGFGRPKGSTSAALLDGNAR